MIQKKQQKKEQQINSWVLGSFLILLLAVLSNAVSAYPPISSEFYGNATHNGSAVSAGAVIQAYDQSGVWCGNFTMVVDSGFGLLSCIGDDTTSTADEGPTTGETVVFTIDGMPTRWFYNYTWISGSFQYVLLDVNYPPTIIIDDFLNSTEDIAFFYDVNGTDPNPGDNVTFSENATFFAINPTTGIISFTPTNDDVGTHPILFWTTDSFGLNTSKIVNFTVINVNDPPFFNHSIEDQVIRAREPFLYDINATDIDVGDTLTYSDNFSLFDIDPSTGLINFTATDEQLGNYSILITVCDDAGSFDSCINDTFTLTILFSNHPPVLSTIGNQIWYANLTVNITINATDEDNDSLTFFTNASLFTINPVTGLILFIPSYFDGGAHIVILGVTDGYYNVSETIQINVLPNLFCGDSLCSSVLIEESCNSCPEDCGECPPATGNETDVGAGGDDQGGSSSGASGAGGVSRQSGTGSESSSGGIARKQQSTTTCVPEWVCSEWSQCINDIETRSCHDANNCDIRKAAIIKQGGVFNVEDIPKPPETQACGTYATCDDGIHNQNETGIDCGGPCIPCVIAPITKYVGFPFLERPDSFGCGDGICSIGEGCFCMKDCMFFPKQFFLFFLALFTFLYGFLIATNYYLYQKGFFKKGKLLRRVKRISMLLGLLLFILLVFSIFLWLYGSCMIILSSLLWLPILIIIIIPLIVYSVFVKFGYVESRKMRRLKHLMERHHDELERILRIEEKTIGSIEVELSREIYTHYQKNDELVTKFPGLVSLYNALIHLVKKKVDGSDLTDLEKNAEKQLQGLLHDEAFKKYLDDHEDLIPLQKRMSGLESFFSEKKAAEAKIKQDKERLEKEKKNAIADKKQKQSTKDEKKPSTETKSADAPADKNEKK